jgi:magnesium-transporting ATPase (P-type)
MTAWSMNEHRLSIRQLDEQYPYSHIDIDNPSQSLGLDSSTVKTLLRRFGPNQISVRRRKQYCVLFLCSHHEYLIHTPFVAVRRDGEKLFRAQACANLVPGDIIHVSANDMIPADCRILSYSEDEPLLIQESKLTSKDFVPLPKTVDMTDDDPMLTRNLCYGGTQVLHGEATLLVCRTGKHSLMNELAKLM